MEKNYSNKFIVSINSLTKIFILLLFFAMSFNSYGQVIKTFTPRTSSLSTPPNQTQYTVKGDFTMLGNTNLTLVTYGDNTSNSEDMKYVDVDSDANTWNSSSSTLALSTENGSVPSCSNIIYAGLYWTGRAGSSNTFNVTKNIPIGGTTTTTVTDTNQRFYENQSIPNTNYKLVISRSGNNNNRIITYTFQPIVVTSGNNTVAFIYRHNSGSQTLHVSVNGGAESPISTSSITSDDAYLASPYIIFTDSSYTLKVNRLKRDGKNSDTGSPTSAYVDVAYKVTVPNTTSVTKSFDKTKVKIKGPTASGYTQITANSVSGSSEINFPSTDYGSMYAGYADITDYVKQNGIGQYYVADIALLEGDGGNTGYYGGWGMVVVYENSKMDWRDITVFDGYAYVCGSCTANYEIPITGINTKQFGDVKLKVGVMSGEGDRGIPGDYFQIQKQIDNSYLTLNNSDGVGDNYFNSSISTGGNARNPNLLNNTGLDISIFNIPNTDKSVIKNSQNTTKFRYGTTQDTYIIFNVAFAVDAYIPEPEGIINVSAINGVANPANLTVLPGGEIEYKLELKNVGTEAISNTKVSIPIPFTSNFVPGSISFTQASGFNPISNPIYVPAPLGGATGSIVWDIGTLPVPTNINNILGTLTFKLKATTDCSLLVNSSCGTIVPLNGTIEGQGVTSGIQFDEAIFQGHVVSGVCEGEKIPTPLIVNIDAAAFVNANCGGQTPIRDFYVCNGSVTSINISEVSGEFPVGTRFYNEYPVTNSSIEYTSSNPFPLSTATYFAIPPGTSICYYEFRIGISATPDVPLATVTTQPTCSVTTGSFTITNYNANYTYTITPSTNVVQNGAVVIAPSGTYTVTAKLNNCTSGNSQNIVINAVPLPPTADAGSDVTINCTTPSTTLTATGGVSYSWSPAIGLSATNVANPTAEPTATTTYTVTVTGSNGCTDTDEVTVTVDKTAPTADAGSDVTINCTTPSTTLTATGG
ncbi:hypothetical protein, partial [Lutibacter sp.]|uniref:hypothetical protein n=1 Tax=Lutibacter sp. TaxID=1925666 RepID=UPI001A266852